MSLFKTIIEFDTKTEHIKLDIDKIIGVILPQTQQADNVVVSIIVPGMIIHLPMVDEDHAQKVYKRIKNAM